MIGFLQHRMNSCRCSESKLCTFARVPTVHASAAPQRNHNRKKTWNHFCRFDCLRVARLLVANGAAPTKTPLLLLSLPQHSVPPSVTLLVIVAPYTRQSLQSLMASHSCDDLSHSLIDINPNLRRAPRIGRSSAHQCAFALAGNLNANPAGVRRGPG